MKLSDEQLLESLKEAGHQEAATALEQKINAQAATGGGVDPSAGEEGQQRSRPGDEHVHGPSRIARAYSGRGEQAANGGEGE